MMAYIYYSVLTIVCYNRMPRILFSSMMTTLFAILENGNHLSMEMIY